jgi:hypothetical protein
MNESILDVLVRQGFAQDIGAAKRLSQELNVWCEQLVALVAAFEPQGRQELLEHVYRRVGTSLERLDAEAAEALGRLPQPNQQESAPQPLPREILEWVRQQTSEAELVAGIQAIRATGGVPLSDVIQRLRTAKASA